VSTNEKEFYDVLNSQYNLVCNRVQAIETKAINITLFTGVILGLEYSILDKFSNNVLSNNKDFLYYLVSLSTSFFFSSIILGSFAIFKSHRSLAYDFLWSDEYNEVNESIAKLTSRIKDSFKENEFKIESKERFLKFSILSFLLGVCIVIWLCCHVMRYSIHS
jgi:hypothetical protein